MEAEIDAEKAPGERSDGLMGNSEAVQSPPPPYSIYTNWEKWAITAIAAGGGLLGPLPANIYFPAIPQLTKVFHESTELLNNTVTVYLVLQGASPMLWGTLSDKLGRRPVFILCLSILTLSCVGLALTPTDAFWLLLLLRCLQAAGCTSTIAIGAGIIGDITESKERGGFFGMFNAGPQLAPCIAPAIGGVLAEKLGWRSIFWFLVILASIAVAFMILFLPETLRTLVGNGSVKPSPLHKTVFQLFGRGKQTSSATKLAKDRKRATCSNPFVILTYPDVIMAQAFTGVVYAVYYAVTSTISSTFAVIYSSLTESELGVCYLTMGVGMLSASVLTGKMLDWDYRRFQRRIYGNYDIDFQDDREKFPIEVARLRLMPVHLVAHAAAILAWSWSLDKGVHIAVPLLSQVVIGYGSIAILNTTMTLMIDILPGQSSAATACTNFVRCSLAAILVACIDRATSNLGIGPTYTLLAGIELLLLPMIYLEMKYGPQLRLKRDIAESS